jgi:hypothetical protein
MSGCVHAWPAWAAALEAARVCDYHSVEDQLFVLLQ